MSKDTSTLDRRTAKSIELGKRICLAREQKGYTQAELAAMLDVTENAVTQYETGRSTARPRRFQLMSEILGVSTTWLLTGNEPEELAKAQTADELQVLEIIREIPLEMRATAIASLRGMADHIKKK